MVGRKNCCKSCFFFGVFLCFVCLSLFLVVVIFLLFLVCNQSALKYRVYNVVEPNKVVVVDFKVL